MAHTSAPTDSNMTAYLDSRATLIAADQRTRRATTESERAAAQRDADAARAAVKLALGMEG